MRIQHNIAALNSYRNLTGNNNAVAKNLEKLSSGYRINRAGDDAAGLAISEKMRAQITGLNTAQKNAQDGVSLVQTAEGALTEVHSMLNRMVELADQSANGTYDNEVDRANLQKEIASLKDEIDRIADSTNFNGINLLDGSLSASKLDLSNVSMAGSTAAKEVAATGATSEIVATAGADTKEETLTIEYKDAEGSIHSLEVKYTNDTNKNTVSENLSNNDITASLQLVPTVMRIFDSRTTLGEVAKKIDLGYTADDIGNMISFSSAEDAQILTLTVVNPNPEHAYIIANAIADTAPIKATEIMDGSSVKVIDYAEQPDHPFSPKVLKNTFMGLVLGFLISVCVAVLIELTDNSIREENDIKKLYPDVPIIGTVPEIKVTLDEKTN